jgi:hypothetical protein
MKIIYKSLNIERNCLSECYLIGMGKILQLERDGYTESMKSIPDMTLEIHNPTK